MTDHRTVDVSVEIAASPEQVWDAIATGPGVSAWLQPTRVGEHEGGEFAFDMGAGWNDSGRVVAWEPPARFATETTWGTGGEATTLATEWLVAARDEGSTVVRMVMSGFGDGEGWDDEIDALTEGMTTALELLRAYLERFAGHRPARAHAFGRAAGHHDEAFVALLAGAGLAGVAVGDRVASPEGAPRLAGTCRRMSPGRFHSSALVDLDEPAPGIAALATVGVEPQHDVHLTFFHPDQDALAAREQQAWQTRLGS